MSPSVLSVENRLRHAVASLEALHRLAAFTQEPREIALFDDIATFANAVVNLTRAVRIHVDAITYALPTTCGAIEAPGDEAVTLNAPDPTLYYLQAPTREIFERLDQQVPDRVVRRHRERASRRPPARLLESGLDSPDSIAEPSLIRLARFVVHQ
jgi:hypothetical protein